MGFCDQNAFCDATAAIACRAMHMWRHDSTAWQTRRTKNAPIHSRKLVHFIIVETQFRLNASKGKTENGKIRRDKRIMGEFTLSSKMGSHGTRMQSSRRTTNFRSFCCGSSTIFYACAIAQLFCTRCSERTPTLPCNDSRKANAKRWNCPKRWNKWNEFYRAQSTVPMNLFASVASLNAFAQLLPPNRHEQQLAVCVCVFVCSIAHCRVNYTHCILYWYNW